MFSSGIGHVSASWNIKGASELNGDGVADNA